MQLRNMHIQYVIIILNTITYIIQSSYLKFKYIIYKNLTLKYKL